jgi:Family of unknown function (DUF5654)
MEIKDNIKENPPAKKTIGQEANKMKAKAKEQAAGYILAAIGLVAGLAWNDAMKALIDYFFPGGQSGILPKFLYAIIITLLVVVAATYISRLLIKDEEKGG